MRAFVGGAFRNVHGITPRNYNVGFCFRWNDLMRRIASYATNENSPPGAKRQVRNREVVSCTFLNISSDEKCE